MNFLIANPIITINNPTPNHIPIMFQKLLLVSFVSVDELVDLSSVLVTTASLLFFSEVCLLDSLLLSVCSIVLLVTSCVTVGASISIIRLSFKLSKDRITFLPNESIISALPSFKSSFLTSTLVLVPEVVVLVTVSVTLVFTSLLTSISPELTSEDTLSTLASVTTSVTLSSVVTLELPLNKPQLLSSKVAKNKLISR